MINIARWYLAPLSPILVPLLTLLLTLAVPAAVYAEGAVRILDCTVIRLCDESGVCIDNTESVSFHMEPVSVDSDGAGDYVMVYDDARFQMQALSLAGPFYWSGADERHTLIASSEERFLWHSLALNPVPQSSIRFLSCSFSQ